MVEKEDKDKDTINDFFDSITDKELEVYASELDKADKLSEDIVKLIATHNMSLFIIGITLSSVVLHITKHLKTSPSEFLKFLAGVVGEMEEKYEQHFSEETTDQVPPTTSQSDTSQPEPQP